MGKPDAPKPADPFETGAAQTATNVSTAKANSFLNNVNQVGPDGTITWDVIGSNSVLDPLSGDMIDLPKWQQTTTLSPEGLALKGVNDASKMNLATLARDQSAKLNDLLGTPVETSNEAVESRLFDLGRKRLDPLFADKRSQLESSLANKGITMGSAGYDTAMRQFGQQENDAYDNLLLTGHGQAMEEMFAGRNQPINEITALMSGSQVNQPQFGATNQYGIPTTDFAGIQAAHDANELQAWQAEMAQRQAMMGGLFSLGSSFIGLSDRRTKKDITELGQLADGLTAYSYRYLWEADTAPLRYGLMADDVEKIKPWAVVTLPDGMKAVDYRKALQ